MESPHGSSHDGADYRLFRQTTRDRLLQEMLKAAWLAAEWKVLTMDEVTVKVMSCSCKMADITDEGISLVEDLNKRRQPLPALEAVYFIQPSHDSVRKFMQDMSGKSPLYKKAYVFFSSPINRNLLQLIPGDQSVLSRVGALREMNLEYLAIDSQGFTTDNDIALEQLFGEHSEGTRDSDSCIETIAARLSTVFASLKEFPYVRYRAPRSAMDASTTATARDLVPTKVAAVLWDKLMKYKASLLNFPQSETGDLLIVDRSIDPNGSGMMIVHALVLGPTQWSTASHTRPPLNPKPPPRVSIFVAVPDRRCCCIQVTLASLGSAAWCGRVVPDGSHKHWNDRWKKKRKEKHHASLCADDGRCAREDMEKWESALAASRVHNR